jgi:cupin 2 domain-containing protein
MSRVEVGHIYAALPEASEAEAFELLHEIDGVRIERIVSQGQATPPGEWYDQDQAEWVILLRGGATILFEGDDAPTHLKPGDHLLIAPHRRHRVEWTDPSQQTVWLAVHVPVTIRGR